MTVSTKVIKLFTMAVPALALVASLPSLADVETHHNGVGRVYEPYVNALEKEFELQSLYQTDGNPTEDDIFRQKIGFGASIGSKIFAEAYVSGKKLPSGHFRLESYELEARMQLTEQGEYAYDWGLLVEYERERSESIHELATAVLVSRDWGRWVTTGNFGVEYEFGSNIDNEIDTFAAGQLRYRYREFLEPGIELYADEFTRGVGPVLSGLIRGQGNNKWHWEAGLILPLNDTTPDETFRLLLEFEF